MLLGNLLRSAATAPLVFSTCALAQETATYTYDALGRLTSSAYSGGPRSGGQAATAFDPAGNRSTYSSNAGSPAPNSTPAFSIADAAMVSEGQAAVFTVTKSAATPGVATVSYSTGNGSAVAPGDYVSASGVLSFQSWETSKTVTVQTNTDDVGESAETFTASLASPTGGASIARATATGVIDGSASFAISNAPAVDEGQVAVFTVTKNGTTSSPASVSFATADGTAVAPGDFGATSGTLTFQAGETSKTISVQTNLDALGESAETFSVSLSNPSGAAISQASATGTINQSAAFSISNASPVNEGQAATFTVTKSGSTAGPATVNFATFDGSAVAPGDYSATSGTLTFQSWETSKTITVQTNIDTLGEAAETFGVSLSAATGGATIAQASATGTINESAAFSISNASAVNEGEVAVFTVTKSGSTAGVATVNYGTADGSAVAPGDYTATSGTLSFQSWETSKTISVQTNVDALAEGTETFSVQLSSPTGSASIAQGSASGAINPSAAPNQPPVANFDTLSVGVCRTSSRNVVANDTDPEGNLPLTVVSFSSPYPAQLFFGTTISVGGISFPTRFDITYVVQDSLGATSTGVLEVTVVDGSGCN